MKFGFIAKHRGYGRWFGMRGARCLVQRLPCLFDTAASDRPRADGRLGHEVQPSFLRTYGARRVWHDVLAVGHACGLHRIEWLMRQHALRAVPGAAPCARMAANG